MPRVLPTALLGAAFAVLALVPLPAIGADEVVETVSDWEVSRSKDDKGAISCLINHTYKDEGDDKASSIAFAIDGDQIATALAYGGWTFEGEKKRTIVLLMGGRIIDPRSRWIAQANVLRTTIPLELQPALLASDTLVLRFKDGDAEFKIPGVREAFAAMKRCETPPPPPPEAHITAYLIGLILQDAITQCEVPTTARQRSELDAKLAALKPEMAGIEQDLRKAAVEHRPTPFCPPPGKKDAIEKFTAKLNTYTTSTPEALSEEVKRSDAEATEKAAAEKAAADAQAKAAEAKASNAGTGDGKPIAGGSASTADEQAAAKAAAQMPPTDGASPGHSDPSGSNDGDASSKHP